MDKRMEEKSDFKENWAIAANGETKDMSVVPPTDVAATPDATRADKIKINKNIVLISLAFFFNFTSYNGLGKLQSSLHVSQGMGVINQSILYAALVVSCLFVPKIVISKIGHKWTIALSFIGYILWMAANGYAVWGTMVPASILVGLCAAPLWTAQCSYFTLMGVKYSRLTNQFEDDIVTRMFGIFFMFFQASNIIGNIISATVLDQRSANSTQPSEADLAKCGVNDCPWIKTNNTNLRKPSSDTVWLMVGIYIVIAAAAVVVVMIFVDQLPKDLVEESSSPSETGRQTCSLLLSTLKHLRHKTQLFIIPLTMYSGFEQAFFSAEWSKSFISCSMGIWSVGLALLPFGVVNAAMSLFTGWLVKYTGRIPIFISGFVIDIVIQTFLFLWRPHPSQATVFYVISGLWGITDAIWQTQINALYGVLFTDSSEAAFSNYRMWESFGFIIAFAYSNFLCTRVKLAILMTVLIVGMMGYGVVETIHRREMKHQSDVKPLETHPGDLSSGHYSFEPKYEINDKEHKF